MMLIKVAIASVGAFIVLFILTKLMGNKQLSQLNMFDYIIAITLGSIGAEMAIAYEEDILPPLISMIVFALLAFFCSLIGNKWLKARRFLEGKSLMLFDKGEFFKKNLKKAKLDVNEVLTQCRIGGYFKIEDIETIFVEANGRLSILPKAEKSPLTPEDMSVKVKPQRASVVLVDDGKVLWGNMKACQKEKSWLDAELQKRKLTLEQVYLGLLSDNKFLVYTVNSQSPDKDIFQ
ncbi:MAG: DUF421 domain-containing protein [Ruminococcus sp.]